ncbi:MAG: PAS domain-containing sensor histidine kinase [Oscillatoriaceae bacterium SKW80]|nr:PAS domain-containing sensor histidine kinase [Oscillatoriaceae bacterium SKYG93]MCX8120043.1 PAS domain-containing sensor histidine kinase [Oscillatoriaceae bacterium SKW80]MDW8454047.1 PAS domain-containing sensor histidine kinase [Oscillatoriaceae cyanobacterium SKYGB_i_bin93]HIK29716.1 PAS domain-containing sensor histidine kinase [Oscillatoriaceae cyanobacterium M7585_C2015_266]
MALSLSKEFIRNLYNQRSQEKQVNGYPLAVSPLVVSIWKRLQQNNEKYRRIFENAAVGIYQATLQGQFLTVNPTLAEIFGYESAQEIIANSSINLKAKVYVDTNRHQELVRLLQEQSAVWRFESQVYRKDGSKIWISENGRLLYNTKGELVGYEGTVEDITYRKQAEVALNEALEKAKELSELNSQFASMVSHELKNSLTIILVSTDLLRLHSQKMTAEEKLNRLEKIRSAVKNMTGLLEGVLTISKAEAGNINLENVRVDVKGFFQEIWQDVQAMTKTNHQFKVICDHSACVTLATDIRLLRQIFFNLILNAVKYSPNATQVECEFSCQGAEAKFRIKDEGIGILPEDKENLFKIFHRGKNARRFEGNGLGLALVKKAVDLHGGNISVESKVGVGTIFTITLPKLSG